MDVILPALTNKREIDKAIKVTAEKVLVLRFGKQDDPACMQMDNILMKTAPPLANMADIFVVDVDASLVYMQYFDISITPATVFFFNGQHMKVDYGTPDHTKFIGTFPDKQDFIDVIEVIYRGAMRGKLIVQSPIDPRKLQKYALLYNDI